MGGGLEEGSVVIQLGTRLADDGKRMLNAVDVLEPEEMGGGLEEGCVVGELRKGVADSKTIILESKK